MNTYIWGPPLWRILHTVAKQPANVTEVQKHNYSINAILFLTSIQQVLPCKYCRKSYLEYYWELHPLELIQYTDPECIMMWVYKLHNLVNKKLNYDCSVLPLDCLHKRYATRPVMCTALDVWEVLSMMALNFTEFADPNQNIAKSISVFIWSLFVLLKQHNIPWAKEGKQFCENNCPYFSSQKEFIEWIRSASGQSVDPYKFEVARAKKCQDKSCI